jgi:hypothetical protein
MATPAQVKVSDPAMKTTAAEDVLSEAFFELLETLPPEKREGLLSDLRANAEAHGE